MDPELALNDIEKLLATRRPATPGIYTLRILDKSIVLERGHQAAGIDGILASLTSRDINEGITSQTWNRIRDRYAIFHKRGLI